MKVVRHLLVPDQPPKTAHWVGFSRVGGEVVMDVGFVEMHELVENIRRRKISQAVPNEEIELHVKVFEQFGMAADTFLRLKQNVDEIYETMTESGDIAVKEDLKEPK
ncbi:MAG: hypothetical protein HY644_04240 [Acidobacteria bacterium]|nr:hypothetical protein [Acidobacteriota bacterium]